MVIIPFSRQEGPRRNPQHVPEDPQRAGTPAHPGRKGHGRARRGREHDYSVLPANKLLEALQEKLDERFPGNSFRGGYADHAITSASWELPGQKDELIWTF